MKNILLIFILAPQLLLAQMSFDKSIKKLGLDPKEIIYTSESVLLFPRGLVYNLSEPDSVTYFGCLSTDQSSFINYFESNSNSLKLKIGSNINRVAGEDIDSISIEKIEQKLSNFKYSDESKKYKIDKSTQHLVIYYWNSEILDRDFIKNYKFFKKYKESHPELNIRILLISTDKI